MSNTMATQSSAFNFDLLKSVPVERRSRICLRSDAGAFIVAIITSLICLAL